MNQTQKQTFESGTLTRNKHKEANKTRESCKKGPPFEAQNVFLQIENYIC